MLELPLMPKCTLHLQLTKLLKLRGMSFKELSIKAGVSIKTLYRWSYGESPIKGLASIYRVAEVLGVTIEELAFSVGEPPPKALLPAEEGSLEGLNRELRSILYNGLKEVGREVELSVVELMALSNPVVVPCYILFGMAKELNCLNEIYNLLSKVGYFDKARSHGAMWIK
ncbi:hypothetical protein BDW_10205 [Bdellovibrio bacteriovorus W]|nr:hypothetical protein BDW_10205 [Bdellovibrio bacteriovorus W]